MIDLFYKNPLGPNLKNIMIDLFYKNPLGPNLNKNFFVNKIVNKNYFL